MRPDGATEDAKAAALEISRQTLWRYRVGIRKDAAMTRRIKEVDKLFARRPRE
jgi:hypothetical protein